MQAENNNSPVFSQTYRVYYEDTDAGGVIYHSNYLKFMERLRTEWLRSRGFSQHELAKRNMLFVVHSASINYRAPGRLDDELEVTATIKEAKKASLVFYQQVRKKLANGEHILLCDAEVKLSFIDGVAFKPKAFPADILDVFLK